MQMKARAWNKFNQHNTRWSVTLKTSRPLLPLRCSGMYLNRWVQSVKEWCAGRQWASLSGRAWGHTGSHLFSFTTHIDRRLSSDLLIHPDFYPPLWEQHLPNTHTHTQISMYVFSVPFIHWVFVVVSLVIIWIVLFVFCLSLLHKIL